MAYSIDPDTLMDELERAENIRLGQARQALSQLAHTNVVGGSPMTRAVSASQREIAATALAQARGQGPSVAGVAAQNQALERQGQIARRGIRGTTAMGNEAANLQAAQQGAVGRAQESQQMLGTGIELSTMDQRLQAARMRKQQELAIALLGINAENEAWAIGRSSRAASARLGQQTQQYQADVARRDAILRTAVGAGISAVGTVGAAAYNARGPSGPDLSGRGSSITTAGPSSPPAAGLSSRPAADFGVA